ncbi:MAG: zinc ABC transporter substrate-binding protein [Gammaproteobacteria bacterium]|nr:zinc ABC transporter substrate-binding protein [Gammaproteobacteria bacterium]
MISRRPFLLCAVCALTLGLAAPTSAASSEPLRVVATFSILGDMVSRIGGGHIALTTLVGPGGDAHVYQPTPAAARAMSEAEVLVVNGLEFEGWLDRLVHASEFEGNRIVATVAIEALPFQEGDHEDNDEHGNEDHDGHARHDNDEHDDHAKHDEDKRESHGDRAGHEDHGHGAFDPHAWLSPRLAVAYVDAITAGLAVAQPKLAGAFYANRAAYVTEIEALDTEIRTLMAALPKDARTVVTSHDAFQYFGRDYELTFLAAQGLSTESEASAKDVAHLIRQMRAQNITAAFVENIADPRLLERIANETGAAIGGTLYPGALSGPDGPASTYLDMMRHNARTLASALGS